MTSRESPGPLHPGLPPPRPDHEPGAGSSVHANRYAADRGRVARQSPGRSDRWRSGASGSDDPRVPRWREHSPTLSPPVPALPPARDPRSAGLRGRAHGERTAPNRSRTCGSYAGAADQKSHAAPRRIPGRRTDFAGARWPRRGRSDPGTGGPPAQRRRRRIAWRRPTGATCPTAGS